MVKRKVKITRERQVNTYSWLMAASRATLKKAEKDRDGSFYQVMASLILTAFMMEAYFNHVGQQKFECWDDLERLSPSSKLNIIAEKLSLEIDKGERPYQTLLEVFKFRNTLAHGKSVFLKSEEIRLVDPPFDGYKDEFLMTDWENYCTQDNADRAQKDTETIIREIQKRAGMTDTPFVLGTQFEFGTLLTEEQVHNSST